MRIDDVNHSPQTQAAEKANSATPNRSQGDKTQQAGVDSTDISPLAKALQPTDPQRLEKLRMDVQSGQYRVSSEKVAKAMVDDALQH